MKKNITASFFSFLFCFTTLLGLNYFSFPQDFPDNIFFRKIFDFLKISSIPSQSITVAECSSNLEFYDITSLEYSYYGAAFIPEMNSIFTVPFSKLIKREIFYQTLAHEVMHFYLHNYFDLTHAEEEGFIIFYLEQKDLTPEYKEYYLTFMNVWEGNIHKFLNDRRKKI